jgi:hypothetical protein
MKNLSLLISLMLILSCQKADKVKKPDKLLSKDQMVAILSDIAVLKTANDVNNNRLSKFIESPFDYVTEKHQVDSLTIAQSIEYYNFQFNDNLSIYKRVEENIKNRKQKIDSINTIIDSLKRNANDKMKNKIKKKSID